MGASKDLLIGRIAVEKGFVAAAKVEECIRIQQQTHQPLGQILLAKGYITKAQLDSLLGAQNEQLNAVDPVTKRRKEAVLFGKLAVREGYVTLDSLNECLAIQAGAGETRTLGAVLIDRGYLTERQVQDLLKKQFKRIMRCDACHLRFTVLTLSEGKNARCPKCKGPLAEVQVQSGEEVATHAEFQTMVLHTVKPAVGKPLQAKCVICDHAFQGTPDSTGRVQCPECKSTFLPR